MYLKAYFYVKCPRKNQGEVSTTQIQYLQARKCQKLLFQTNLIIVKEQKQTSLCDFLSFPFIILSNIDKAQTVILFCTFSTGAATFVLYPFVPKFDQTLIKIYLSYR